MSIEKQKEFDYVIIGGGSAGLTLASRLTEDPSINVCLLEAGVPDKNMLIHIPFGLSLLSRLTTLGWGYDTEPQIELENRKLYIPRGKTLGGSSSINAMCYIRGVKQDYDSWAASGAEGWDWNSVLPYFKKSENQERGESELHGVGGPLSVSDLRHVNPMSRVFIKAREALGLNEVEDFNGEERRGLGVYQVTQVGGQRCSTSKGYLSIAKERPNLTVITKALVEKIILEEKKAVGVEYSVDGKTTEVYCIREVLLSAGAINSPQVLMLSGIGPKRHLSDIGIETKVDIPGVGQNLQDHLDAILQHRTNVAAGYGLAFRAIPGYIKAAFQYMFGRKGMLSSNVAEAGGFDKTAYAGETEDIQYHFLPAILHDHGRKTVAGYGYGLHICHLYPESRGEIRLKSANPADAVAIDPKFLTHENDKKVMIEAVKKGRKILGSAEFDQYNSTELLPGRHVESDEDILNFVRKRSETIYHPVGTCKMGAVDDETTVVDSELRVKGVEGLRVVDASVMPTLIGGNTNAPTIMIAEKIADLMKQNHK
jgi:choline dehydrogenase-like flavoprotein